MSPVRVVRQDRRNDDYVPVLRRNRPEGVAEPDAVLMTLAESTGAAARAAGTFRDSIALVLQGVADDAGWRAGHAWVPGDKPGTWVSSGLWYPDDGIGLGGLRNACVDSGPIQARGHLALALHLQGTQWVGDLGGLVGTPLHAAASAAGVVSAIACPVYADGKPVAILEWYLATPRRPSPDFAHVLGHLSGVLSEIAERPVRTVPEQGKYVDVRATLQWVTEDGVLSRVLAC